MNRISRRMLACAAAMAVAALAHAAPAPVYRCTLANGGTLYTDVPCAGGEALDLHAGEADPRAIERLKALQQDESARYSRERAMAQAQAAQSQWMEPPGTYVPPTPPPNDEFVDGYGFYGYAPYALAPADARHHRARPPGSRRRPSVVPAR